jgi:hypothetical protein
MRVFLSSTAVDLINHRLAVAAALERLGLALARMESFGTRPTDPVSACSEEIEDSELFVGLYAHRYGHIPEGSEISITELEFDRARNLRRPTFCFFVEEGYPWPEDMIEQGPGEDKLRKFKSKIEKLVIRDVFTTPDMLATRVASSVGRYLLSDPRRQNARKVVESALSNLADLSAAVFVDLMRLVNVGGGDRARTANSQRYAEFVDIADQHFADFRIQVSRATDGTDADIVKQCTDLEGRFGWALTRLRREPCLDRPWRQFAALMAGAGEKVHLLASTASPEYYSRRRGEVLAVVEQPLAGWPLSTSEQSADFYVERRHFAQNLILAKMREASDLAIASVRDDMDRVLAIPYFTVDLVLLRQLTS